MGDWRTETVIVGKVEKHPNADTLSIATVFGGYPVIIKTGEFKEGDYATYVAVDTLVPVAEERFKFLDSGKGRTHERVKAKKLRQVFSQGLLVAHVPGTVEGEDVSERLGCLKYVPPSERDYTPNVKTGVRDPKKSETYRFERNVLLVWWAAFILSALVVPFWVTLSIGASLAAIAYGAIRYNRYLNKKPHYAMYDVEPWRKWSKVLYDGEDVTLTEKLHGCLPRETRIRMADGSKKEIQDIVIGDQVAGMDADGALVSTPVTATFRNGIGDFMKVSHSDGGITLTPNHRVWCPDKASYVPAGELKIGDKMVMYKTEMKEVTVSSIEKLNTPRAKFDIETGTHNFFAGGGGILVHNSNASYAHNGKRFFMKSRTTFRGNSGGKGGWAGTGEFDFDDVWAKIADLYGLKEKLKTRPNMCVFGEIVGHKIQDMEYGCGPNKQKFFAFDVWDITNKRWLDYDHFLDFCRELDIPVVPELYRGPWSDSLVAMAEGKSMVKGANHIREGWVCRPIVEREHAGLGRVALKCVAQAYLLRKTTEEQ